MRTGSSGGPIAMPPVARAAIATRAAERTVSRVRGDESCGKAARAWLSSALTDSGLAVPSERPFSDTSPNDKTGSFRLLSDMPFRERPLSGGVLNDRILTGEAFSETSCGDMALLLKIPAVGLPAALTAGGAR